MGILIRNITGDGVPDDAPHDYVLHINGNAVTRFQHVRSEGLAECLRRAADAVDSAGEGKAAYDRARAAADGFDPFMVAPAKRSSDMSDELSAQLQELIDREVWRKDR